MRGWLRRTFGWLGRRSEGWRADGGSFQGASFGRLLWDWAVSVVSPDRELYTARQTLRARARDLARNNSHVAGYVEELAIQTVGAEGISFQSRLSLPDGKPWRDVNFAIEDAWTEFSHPEHFTVTGQMSRPEFERLVVKTWAIDGEVFIRRRVGYDSPFGYAVQLLDADLVDESYNVPPNDAGVEIRMGVEVNADGRPIAYHVFKRHPRDMNGPGRGGPDNRVRIPASEIIHLFTPYRPGQTRGYSWFAPVLADLKMLAGLQEAELVASRLHAAKGGFITNKTEEAIAAYVERLRTLSKEEFLKQVNRAPLQAAPGVIPELAPGQEFQQFDPSHPNSAFEPFTRAILRSIGRGLGASYSTFTGDLSQANYGSQRGGLLPERDRYRTLQQVLCVRVCRPVYRDWIASALLARAIALPARAPRVPSAYYAVEFEGRGWDWIDPLKDIAASDLEIKLGVNSRKRIAAARGRDYEEIVDDLAEEEAYAREAGVYVGGKAQTSAREGAAGSNAGRSPEANHNRLAHLMNGNGKA